MYCVYILKSVNYLKTYIGITDNIDRRLKEHNLGYNYYSRRYLPWIIIYNEKHRNRLEARKREIYLKSAAGRRWIKENIFR